MAYQRSFFRNFVLVSFLGITIGTAYFVATGFSRTTLSLKQADQLYGQVFEPGKTLVDTDAWLAMHDIPRCSSFLPDNVCYNIWYRREDAMPRGEWMGSRGNQSMAECAGLDVEKVFALIQVNYPNSTFGLRSWVRVYLFFDLQGRLLKHWVDEVHLSL